MILLHETLTTSEMPQALQGGKKVVKRYKPKKKNPLDPTRKGVQEVPIGTFSNDSPGELHSFSANNTPTSNQDGEAIQTG